MLSSKVMSVLKNEMVSKLIIGTDSESFQDSASSLYDSFGNTIQDLSEDDSTSESNYSDESDDDDSVFLNSINSGIDESIAKSSATSKHVQKMNQTDYAEPSGQCRLLLVSLLDNFCSMYDKNPRKNRKLFKSLCQKLSSMGILKSLDFLDDSKSIRSVYREAFKAIVLEAVQSLEVKEVIQDPTIDSQPLSSPSIPIDGSLESSALIEQHHTFSHFLNNSTNCSSIPSINLGEEIFLSGRSRYREDFVEGGVLGRGGYGKVVVATNKLDGNSYAIKKIHFSGVSSTRFSRILREVKSLARLDHPNIVRYNSAWIEDHSVILEKIEDSLDARDPKNIVHELDNLKFEESTSKSSTYHEDDEEEDTFTSGMSSTQEEEDADEACLEDQIYTNVRNSDETHIFHAPSSQSFSGPTRHSRNASLSAPHHQRFHFQDRKIMYIQMELCRFTLDQYIKARNKFYFECLDDFKATGRLPDSLSKLVLHDKTDRSHVISAERLFTTTSSSCEISLNPVELDFIFKGIVKGLHYIHENGMIHRDLKPLNIFFHNDLSPKIGDFGLVSEMKCSCGFNCSLVEKERADDLDEIEEEGGLATPVGSCSHTKGVGTVTYASPEQLNQQDYSQKSDIYSLGIICFELFYPVATQMERNRVLSDLKQRHKFPEAFLKQWPKEAAFIWSCIARDSEVRPSAAEILESEWLERDHEEIISRLERDLSTSRRREDELLQMIEALKSENFELKNRTTCV